MCCCADGDEQWGLVVVLCLTVAMLKAILTTIDVKLNDPRLEYLLTTDTNEHDTHIVSADTQTVTDNQSGWPNE